MTDLRRIADALERIADELAEIGAGSVPIAWSPAQEGPPWHDRHTDTGEEMMHYDSDPDVDCPTCGGEGGWQDDYVEDGVERDGMAYPRECPDCLGYGAIGASQMRAMLVEGNALPSVEPNVDPNSEPEENRATR